MLQFAVNMASQNRPLYRWRKKYRGLNSSEAKRLKAIEEENRRLKRLLAEKELEIQMLTDVIKENF